MKFYYKGQLVRTSKTHDYNWAIIDELKDGTLVVWGCRADRKAADAEAAYLLKRGHLGIRVVPLDTEPDPPALTFDQFMALAVRTTVRAATAMSSAGTTAPSPTS